MVRKWLTIGIILLFVGVTIAPTINFNTVKAQDTEKSQSTSRGNWLYVGGSGPGNYTRIQDAINDSKFGDTVYVYDDSSPYIEFLIINTSISLIGENKNTTIIKGQNKITQHIIQINANKIHLHGFTIQNSTDVNDEAIGYYGVLISSNNNDISENILTDNAGGILAIYASRNKIYENIIKNGTFYSNAIRVEHGWKNDIFNNTVSEVGFGVEIRDSGVNTIHGNSFTQIRYEGVIIFKSRPWYTTICNKIYKNYISGAENGIQLLHWCWFSFIYLNEIANCRKYGLYRSVTDFVFILENNFVNNTCNSYFYEKGIFNQWSRNYWDDWNGSGYYTITGEGINLMDPEGDPVPLEQYDKHPAHEPYDVPGMRY